MDVFATAFLVSTALLLVGVLAVGVTAMLQVRSARRARLQMKRHLQRIYTDGGDRITLRWRRDYFSK
jgi:hypothetical protein